MHTEQLFRNVFFYIPAVRILDYFAIIKYFRIANNTRIAVFFHFVHIL